MQYFNIYLANRKNDEGNRMQRVCGVSSGYFSKIRSGGGNCGAKLFTRQSSRYLSKIRPNVHFLRKKSFFSTKGRQNEPVSYYDLK